MRMCVCLCSCWWCLAFFFRAVVISHPYSKLFTVSRARAGSATSDVDRESLLERGRAIPTGRIFIAHATARPPTRSRVRTAANRRVAAMGGPCWLLKPNGQRLGAPDCTDNFQISKFEFRGTAYHSVEQAFQCLKFTPGSATSRAVVISHPYSKLFTVSRGRGSATSDVDRESLLERGRAIPTGRIFIAHATARPPTRSRVRTAANRRVAAMGGPCWLLKPNGQRLGAPDCTDNFQISKFEFRGTAYHSVEQAFQCLKFTPGSATSRQRRHIRGKARIHEVMACACGKRARAGRTS